MSKHTQNNSGKQLTRWNTLSQADLTLALYRVEQQIRSIETKAKNFEEKKAVLNQQIDLTKNRITSILIKIKTCHVVSTDQKLTDSFNDHKKRFLDAVDTNKDQTYWLNDAIIAPIKNDILMLTNKSAAELNAFANLCKQIESYSSSREILKTGLSALSYAQGIFDEGQEIVEKEYPRLLQTRENILSAQAQNVTQANKENIQLLQLG